MNQLQGAIRGEKISLKGFLHHAYRYLYHGLRSNVFSPVREAFEFWQAEYWKGGLAKRNRRLATHLLANVQWIPGYWHWDEEGTQSPVETLKRGGGSCRDYALLMMEAVRRLGVAARFVSGYLYDGSLDDGGGAMSGAGVTLAWLQVYLPGAGWLTYDPTNNLIGGSQLIRVGVVRDPAFAAPVSGSWFGDATAYLGMSATVQVRRRGPERHDVRPGHNSVSQA